MKEFIFSAIFSIILFPSLVFSKESVFPPCDGVDNWATQLTASHMVKSGLLKDAGDIFNNGKDIKTKTLDTERLGVFSIPNYPKGTLYRQIFKISLRNKQGTPFELITISEASDIECSMSAPAIILISPEFKVLSGGKPYDGKLLQ